MHAKVWHPAMNLTRGQVQLLGLPATRGSTLAHVQLNSDNSFLHNYTVSKLNPTRQRITSAMISALKRQ